MSYTHDGAVPARGIVPATMWGHNDAVETPEFDLEEARRLIEESGVPAAERRISMAYISRTLGDPG